MVVATGTTPRIWAEWLAVFRNTVFPRIRCWSTGEMTQACGLALQTLPAPRLCRMCNPLELTATEQGKRFLRQLVDFGDPLPT